MSLILATSSAHKAREIALVLERPLTHLAVDLPELQTIHPQDVIEAKVRAAYAQVQQPVLVEDTGLLIHGWHGLPGALIRWFLETVGTAGICTMIEKFPDRSATAIACIGYFNGKACHTFLGETTGTIAPEPRGTRGFGWDPIFIPDGYNRTFAELSEAEMVAVSMRRKVALALKAYLDAHEG